GEDARVEEVEGGLDELGLVGHELAEPGGEVVDDHDLPARFDEAAGDVGTDVPSAAGDDPTAHGTTVSGHASGSGIRRPSTTSPAGTSTASPSTESTTRAPRPTRAPGPTMLSRTSAPASTTAPGITALCRTVPATRAPAMTTTSS